MTKNQLGHSDLEITALGLGTWAMGGDGTFGWGHQDDAESIKTIHHAVASGMNWIDTAPVYGVGHAETIVGQALKSMPQNERPLIFSKCSLIWDAEKTVSHSLKADSIRNEIEASLKRLQLETLDLCQIHWPSFPPGSPAPDIEEGWQVLAALKKEGKIRHIGVSNFNVSELQRLKAIEPPASLQPPYSMLMRGIEDDILPYCEKEQIGILAYSTMQNGLLSGRMTRERIEKMSPSDWRVSFSAAFKEPRLTQNLELVERLRAIGKQHSRSVAEVAIAWTLRKPVVTAAIVGARSPEQIDGFVAAMDFRLNQDEIEEIARQLPETLPGLLDFS